ncbi:MAG: hypothetical protein NVSMB19_08270 [Vulcanimicrobiaceae bacterium]
MNLAFDRRMTFVAALAVAASLSACTGHVSIPAGSPPTARPLPSPTATVAPKAIVYTALGASDAVGFGASVPCANPPVVADPTCPGGTGYVPLLAAQLAKTPANVTLLDLGISSAVIGPDIAAVGNQYGSGSSGAPCKPRTGTDVIPGDFITNELPKLKGNETLVTIFAGGNDTIAIVNAAACMKAGGSPDVQIQAFIKTEISAFGSDLTQLLSGIRAKAPAAAIVVANLPNFAGVPFAQKPSVAPAKPLLQAVSVGIDTNVYQVAATTFGIPTVDLLCDPRSYDPNNFFTDGFHPNDAGYATLAGAFFAQIVAATPALPKTSCPQMSLGAKNVVPAIAPLPDFNRS